MVTFICNLKMEPYSTKRYKIMPMAYYLRLFCLRWWGTSPGWKPSLPPRPTSCGLAPRSAPQKAGTAAGEPPSRATYRPSSERIPVCPPPHSSRESQGLAGSRPTGHLTNHSGYGSGPMATTHPYPLRPNRRGSYNGGPQLPPLRPAPRVR